MSHLNDTAIPLANLATWRPGSQVAALAGPGGPARSGMLPQGLADQRLTDLGYESHRRVEIRRRLDMRDRVRDRRRMCIECLALDRRGRCHEAAAGRLPGVPRDLTPVPDLLHNCPLFRGCTPTGGAR